MQVTLQMISLVFVRIPVFALIRHLCQALHLMIIACPSGERMTCGSGKKCQMREMCTQNKGGRVIERSEFQDIIDENNRRVIDNPDYYKLRRAIIEHPLP